MRTERGHFLTTTSNVTIFPVKSSIKFSVSKNSSNSLPCTEKHSCFSAYLYTACCALSLCQLSASDYWQICGQERLYDGWLLYATSSKLWTHNVLQITISQDSKLQFDFNAFEIDKRQSQSEGVYFFYTLIGLLRPLRRAFSQRLHSC